jgi:hypothetical protein
MPKSEVYSWRLSPDLKHRLSLAARAHRVSLAQLLETITAQWLRHQSDPDDEARQRALHEALEPCIGTIQGDDPDRSKRVHELVREKLGARRRAQSE